MQDLQRLVQGALDSLGEPGQKMTPRKAAQLPGVRGKASYETIRQIVNGTHSGDLSDRVVEGLVALGINRADILRAAGRTHLASLPAWVPPASANRMTLKQRRVVETLIGILVDREESVDRPTNEQSSSSDVTSIQSRSVTSDRLTAENDEPIVQADVGELVEQTPEEREYVDVMSDAALNRLRRRLLGE